MRMQRAACREVAEVDVQVFGRVLRVQNSARMLRSGCQVTLGCRQQQTTGTPFSDAQFMMT